MTALDQARGEPDSAVARGLRLLSRAVYRRPKLFLLPQILLVGMCVFYTIRNLQFSTNRNDLLGEDKAYHKAFLEFKQEFTAQDDLAVVVESEDPEKNRQFVERLGAKLEKDTNIFSQVLYKGDFKMLGPKALFFLDEPTLDDLHKTLKEYRPFLLQFTHATNLNSLFLLINRQFRTAKREENAENESLVKAVPALRRIIDQAEASLQRPGTPPSPGITALFDTSGGDEAEEREYFTFAKGRFYLLNAQARNESLNEKAVERLREAAAETEREVPGVNVGVVGEPVLETDEMLQSQKDSTVATVVSLLLCAFIFIYSYRETGRPLKATLSLIVGLGYTMGYTTLVVGHLNILTITFLPILIGLAIDFGVHLITRYEEELRHGRTEEYALEKAMVNTGLGILTGALTTAGAFFAMALTDFKGIQEMGIITGGGMLVCLVPMMTLLPVLLLKGRQNVMDHHAPAAGAQKRARIERWWLERPALVAGVTAAICVLGISQFRKVYFDYNLLNMQSKGLPSVEFTRKLIYSGSKSVLFGVVLAKTADEAVRLENQLTNLPAVASVDSIAKFVTGDQTQKQQKIDAIKRELRPIRFAEMDPGPVRIPELALTLFGLQGYLGLALDAIASEKDPDQALIKELGEMRRSIINLRASMQTLDAKMVVSKLTAFQQAFFRDLRETFDALKNQDTRSGLRPRDLPESLQSRFIGKSGTFLLQVYPKHDVWQREHQQEFVRQLRTIDPNVTGTPVQLLEYTSLLKDSYIKAAWYALGAIAIMVLVHFRSITCLILALLPVAIGSIWMGGLMGLLDVPFNPANIMTLPLVIGIGVTNGIHILNRFAEEKNPSILAKSTGKAVLVSALNTIAGFGSLIPAKHEGIASLGIVMSVGVATCMIAALTFLPALLTLLIKRGWTIKKPSGDNALSTLGREEPR